MRELKLFEQGVPELFSKVMGLCVNPHLTCTFAGLQKVWGFLGFLLVTLQVFRNMSGDIVQ